MADDGDLERALAEVHEAAFAWALSCCRWDRTEAEEVLQMTYLKVLDGSARFDGRAAFKTWLFAVVRRTARGRRRAWLGWLRRRADGVPEAVAPAAEPSLDGARVRAALAALPARQREVLDLVFFHDLTVDQAAGVMGVSAGAARQHYARGKAGLARRLS
jgi:RNA polymerase sigma-70 factor (ECF subfamily)